MAGRVNRSVYFDVRDVKSANLAEKVNEKLSKKNIVGDTVMRIIDYAAYCNIAETDADVVVDLRAKSGNGTEVDLAAHRIEKCTGNPKRDNDESYKLVDTLEHGFAMIGYRKSFTRSVKIDYEEVEKFPWFTESKVPYVRIEVEVEDANEDMIADAISTGIAKYFGR